MFQKRRSQKKAFSMIEILVLIAIISILFVVLIGRLDFATDKAKTTGVQNDFRAYQLAIQTVAREKQEIPTELGTLAIDLNKNLDESLVVRINTTYLSGADDPWGSAYKLTVTLPPDTRGSVLIQSYGPDRTADTEDDIKSTVTYEKTEFGGSIVIGTDGSDICDHEFGDWIIVSEYSCITDGERYRVCENCGLEERIFEPAPGHDEDENGICKNCSEDARAGLYVTGTDQLLMSWQQLIDSGIISEDGGTYDGAIALLPNQLNGDLVLPRATTHIDVDAFKNCTLLTGVEIPKKCEIVHANAFYGCTSLKDVQFEDGSVCHTFGAYVFYGCSNLKQISIPDALQYTNIGVFKNCSLLNNVTFGANAKLQKIEIMTFEGCLELKSISIPRSITIIAENAFQGSGLESIHIPNNVGSLREGVFLNCTSLAYVTFEEGSTLSSVPNSCFEGCTAITGITLPDSITTIGSSVFRNCTSLTTINIPSGVTSIGNYAFYKCSNLSCDIVIPSGVTKLGSSVFYQCAKIPTITIHDNLTSFDSQVFDGCKSLQTLNIPEGTTVLPFAFARGCESLTELNLPSSLVEIKGDAFKDIKVNTIVIPNGVTEIGSSAFECEFKNIYLPNSITSSGVVPFGIRPQPENIYYDGGVSDWNRFMGLNSITMSYQGSSSPTTGANLYLLNSNGEYELVVDLIVPNDVTEISQNAFEGIISLKSVYLHDGVEEIGGFAFSSCPELHTVRLPNNSSISARGFTNSHKVQNIEFGPNGVDFSSYTFSMDLPKNIYFRGTVSEYLANCTFDYGYGLEALYLYNSTTEEFDLVEHLIVPNDVTTIPEYAFNGCPSLISITIGSQVTKIGKEAFVWCEQLTSLTVLAVQPPELGTNAITDYSHLKIYVPAESVGEYKAADGWSNFASKIYAIP